MKEEKRRGTRIRGRRTGGRVCGGSKVRGEFNYEKCSLKIENPYPAKLSSMTVNYVN